MDHRYARPKRDRVRYEHRVHVIDLLTVGYQRARQVRGDKFCDAEPPEHRAGDFDGLRYPDNMPVHAPPRAALMGSGCGARGPLLLGLSVGGAVSWDRTRKLCNHHGRSSTHAYYVCYDVVIGIINSAVLTRNKLTLLVIKRCFSALLLALVLSRGVTTWFYGLMLLVTYFFIVGIYFVDGVGMLLPLSAEGQPLQPNGAGR